jgi:hypothetical protein
LIGLAQTQHWASVYPLSHSIEVDEKTEEHLISGRAIFMDSAEIAENRYARHVLAMESENAGGLLTQS